MGQRKVEFVEKFVSEQNQQLERGYSKNDVTTLSTDVTTSTDIISDIASNSSMDETMTTDASTQLSATSDISQSTQSSQSTQGSVLGLGNTLSDSSLARIRRKAFRTLTQTRGQPEGDSTRPCHPSLVGGSSEGAEGDSVTSSLHSSPSDGVKNRGTSTLYNYTTTDQSTVSLLININWY